MINKESEDIPDIPDIPDISDIPDENVGIVNRVRDFAFVNGVNHNYHHKKHSQKILGKGINVIDNPRYSIEVMLIAILMNIEVRQEERNL